MQSTSKRKLNCHDRLDQVPIVMKDNDVTDHIDVVYTKNKTEFPWPIRPSVVNEENQTGQRHDRSYKSGLPKNNNELAGPIRPSAVYD